MKTFSQTNKKSTVAALATFIFTLAVTVPAQNILAAEPALPNVIQFEIGAQDIFSGDQIVVTNVRGDRKHIEPGGSYCVEGSYTLGTADHAALALYCTTRGPSGPTPVQFGQKIMVAKGMGQFHLYETNIPEGWLHVSFYPSEGGASTSGVYFGERGRTNTLLQNAGWMKHSSNVDSLQGLAETGIMLKSQQNVRILKFLGNPVPMSANSNPHYAKDKLIDTLRNICRAQNLNLLKIDVDESEFPPLLFGVLADGRHVPGIPEIDGYEDYSYGGAVRDTVGDKSYFALNIVPSKKYPENWRNDCSRRLAIRLQMLAAKARSIP